MLFESDALVRDMKTTSVQLSLSGHIKAFDHIMNTEYDSRSENEDESAAYEMYEAKDQEINECRSQISRLTSDQNEELAIGSLWQHEAQARGGGLVPLFGLSKEIALLRAIYDQISDPDHGASEVVMVNGKAGCGKSSLVAGALREYVSRDHDGYYVSGKNDLMRREPYAALVEALTDLCDLILQSDDMDSVRSSMKQEIGSVETVSILTKLIPNLSFLLRSEDSGGCILTEEDQSGHIAQAFPRFVVAIQSFLRCIATESHPVVLVLDDIQWADEASLSIIDEIVAGADTSKHVLIVLIRRCESDSAEDVPTRLVHREHSVVAGLCSRITSIEVGNLTCQQTNEWISALTRLPEDDTMDLARVVYKKTGGHAFFIEQFLDMLRATRLLTYSPTQMNWIWCLASIEAETYSTDNVVDLVLGRIMRLPIHIRCILTLASCLGYSFDIGWLKLLVRAESDSEFNTLPNLSTILCEDDMPLLLVNYEDNLSEILSTAVEEGMIENDSRKPNKWKFVHDKVASVLYSMVPTTSSSREILHSRIGRIFLRSIKGKTKAEQSIIFLAAEQLNRGSSTLRVADSKEKLVLSLLNLQTAKLAATKSAFLLAANYLKEGVAQLDPITTWNEHYQLSLQLVSSSARMELIAGNFEESARMVEIVLTHASTLEDKLPAYKIKLQLLSAQSRLREAIEVGFNVLRQLGERIPLKARKVHIILEITRTKIMLTRKSDYDLVSIPQTTNKDCVNVLDFLATMAICTYMKSTAQNTFMLVCLRLMNLSVRHGLAKTSVYGFAGYAMLQGFLGNHDQAYRFANLTFALLDRLDAKEQAPQVIFSLNLGVTHWCQPFRMVFDCLERCYSLGRQVGDIDAACRASMLFTNTAFHCGMSLPVIEENARKSCHEMFRLQQHFTMRLLLPLWQCVLNLAGENGNDPSILSGEAMELASGLSHIPEEDSHFFNQFDCYFSLVLAYSFENLAKAAILLKELEEKYKPVPGNYSEYTRAFMYGMTYHALYRRDNLRAHKRAARALLRKFDRWTKDGVLNAVPSYLLLKAMDLSLSGNTREVRKAFDAAIAAAAESGFLFHQALANEKAFEALRSMGNYASAEGYLVSSIDLYETYGAHAKVRWLEERNDRSCHSLSPPKVIDVGNTVAVLRI